MLLVLSLLLLIFEALEHLIDSLLGLRRAFDEPCESDGKRFPITVATPELDAVVWH